MQLLFYLLLLTIYIDFTAFNEVYRLVFEFYHLKASYTEIFRVFIILPAYTIVLVISILITIFFRFHLSLVLHNTTTIEALDPLVWVENKFNLGKFENWESVFGENFILWFFPLLSDSGVPKGDGLLWKTNEP
jgi:palmitoyltransferase